ncbi:uncharacterized protein LOC101707632 [Heterocephalus glaber]|uniref:Uncharacterized protein LOC101707632 n=1 Tax=Heterocephalus glaber TaxID=10181 RepID=A0AAX6QL05_HETGA|nr:uncharacterized protein LOC101707632 [Heterocephalus glaber]
MEEVKKEEDTVGHIQPPLLGPTPEPQLSRAVGRAPTQEDSMAEAPRGRRLHTVDRGQRAPTPSSLPAPWLGRSPTSRTQPVVRSRAKDFTHSIWFLNHAKDRALRMKPTPPARQSRKSHRLAGTLFPVSLGTAKRPGLQALRSLMDSPPGGFPSAPGDLRVSAADSASGSAPTPTHITSPVLPSLVVRLETGLNHLLQPLIPDDNVRGFITEVISILEMDCAEPPAPLTCAKLIAKSRRLLMLLTGQREATVSQAQGEQQQLLEGTEAHGKQKGQQTPRMFREHVPKGTYIYKYIIGTLAALVMILITVVIVLCVRQVRTADSRLLPAAGPGNRFRVDHPNSPASCASHLRFRLRH